MKGRSKFLCCVKNENSCLWREIDSYGSRHNDSVHSRYKPRHDASGRKMLTFEWLERSESLGGNNHLNDKHSRLTFLRDSNNNKPNRWKRIRKKIQKRFLHPWSNQIPNPLVSANNNKRSELVRVTNIPFGDVGKECRAKFGRTLQGFDTIDFESTQMHARLK